MAVNIMIQGTMSSAGKSLISTGLCRIFKQDGYRAAPFKSQNMALNSFITDEGLEMGRAQVVQAEACGRIPSVLMNPILLKPTTDTGSQVIVNGKVLGSMSASDYFKYKKKLIPDILSAYEKLAADNDIIVIEGAGSPAEINLKSDDIVNMGLAEMLDAPVLLVGDIDRGGVFAQLAGTVMLLEEHERLRIKGMIINKFRGDLEILRPGLKMTEDICNIPVLGVVPYADVDIDDEDSLTERFSRKKLQDSLNICVVRLPRISNFSDFSILDATTGVNLMYADSPEGLNDADIIIIPGTKSTISDLDWMKRKGIGNAVIRAARSGATVIGICGGYQMLGEKITDISGVEAKEKHTEISGLGILPIVTEFNAVKETVQTEAAVCADKGMFAHMNGINLKGYEIHMGKSRITDESAGSFASIRAGDRYDGCVCGNVLGTYIHGLFDSREFTEKLLETVSGSHFSVPDIKAYKEEQYDRLADILRMSLDMEKIYRIMGITEH
jgi:adenosylcobyric acid synthase